MIAIRCPHRQRTVYPTISALPPPPSPSARRLCLCVKCPSSRLSHSFVGAAPCFFVVAASARKHFSATRSTAVKNILNSSGASTRPCLRPCPTSNLSEHSSSSNRTRACMPSCNWRVTTSILGGTPKRARTSHRRIRSTDSYALVRSIKHMYKEVLFFRASFCSRRTTNIMSTVERGGLNPHCSSGRMFSRSQQSLRRPAMTLRSIFPPCAT